MFGCQENQKEKLHFFHKETHENSNNLNPITLAKVQNSTTMGSFGLSLFLLKLKTEIENTVAK